MKTVLQPHVQGAVSHRWLHCSVVLLRPGSKFNSSIQKTNKLALRHEKTDQPKYQLGLIRVYAVRMKKLGFLSHSLNAHLK